MKEVRLGNKVIGDGHPAYTIAEMAWSHDGSVEKARRIIQGAADAGADAVSVHITSMKDYMVRDYGASATVTLSVGQRKESVYEYLERINLTPDNWQVLFDYARSLGLAVCAMPNDMQSLRLCQKLNPDSYVIAAACFAEKEMVTGIARQKKPLVLRIGGATLGEIEEVVNLTKAQGAEDLILLQGIQLYPTKIEDTHLKLLPSLKAIFQVPAGLADHLDGGSTLASIVPLMALAFGANVIEKHLTHDRALKGEDYISALTPADFKQLVATVREVEKSFGSAAFRPLSTGEQRYRMVSRKRTVAARLIKRGDIITRETLTFKRADSGVYPAEISLITGHSARQDIKEDEPITWDKVL